MNPLHTKITDLRAEGHGPKAIARKLKVEVDQVHSAIQCARRRGETFPALRSGRPPAPERPAALPKLSISTPLYAALTQRARSEHKSPSEMAAKLLQDALLGGHPDA